MAKKIGIHTITVKRQAKVDRLSTTPAAAPADHEVKGCAILPKSTFEEGKGWTITDDKQVFAPYGADVLPGDKVLLPGDPKPWNVDGTAGDYENKRGVGKATIINLTRTGKAAS